jgi:hypothetical protein
MATQLRGEDQPRGADALHHRATHLLGGLHGQTTMLKEPTAPASVVPQRAPVEAPPAPTLPKPDPNQRLDGVSLREVLGSTGAVRKLEDALDQKGAPRPLVPDLTPRHGLHIAPEEEFLVAERKRRQRTIAIVAAVLVAAMAVLLVALH